MVAPMRRNERHNKESDRLSKWVISIIILSAISLLASMSNSRTLPSTIRRTITTGFEQQASPQIRASFGSSVSTPYDESQHAPAFNVNLPSKRKLPRLVWLMAFPQSLGVKYTMTNTQISSGHTVATTYFGEVYDPVPAIPYIKSPYVFDSMMPVPKLVLTKTNCATDCEACMQVFLGREEFRKGCRSFTVMKNDGKMEIERFAENLVAKAVHFIRNPFDNIVDRMHHGINVRKINATWTPEMISRFNETQDGISAWCEHLDSKFEGDVDELMQSIGVGKELYEKLPCHTELWRWVQWNNMAIETTQSMQIPVLVLYFEDYLKNFKRTFRELFRFMELSQVNDFMFFTPAFATSYVSLFSDETGRMATEFVRAIASPGCWSRIQHYFDQWLDNDESQNTALSQ